MRAHHLDVARALCIALVVFGHSPLAEHYDDVNQALSSFRMPMFFMIAGAFFRPAPSAWPTARAKGEALLKPYLTVALLYAPFQILLKQADDASHFALGALSINGPDMPGWLGPMWFLGLLWALHTGGIWFVRLTRFNQINRPGQMAWLLALLIAGYSTLELFWMRPISVGEQTWMLHGLPLSLDVWPLAAAFFFTGHMLQSDIRQWRTPFSVTLSATLVFLITTWLYAPSVGLLGRHYADLVSTTVAALSGSLALIGWAHLASASRLVQQGLAPLGRLSLYVLLFHAPIVSLTSQTLRAWWPDAPQATAWLSWIVTLLITAGIGQVIQHVWALRALFEPMHKVRRPTQASSLSGDAQASKAR